MKREKRYIVGLAILVIAIIVLTNVIPLFVTIYQQTQEFLYAFIVFALSVLDIAFIFWMPYLIMYFSIDSNKSK